MEATTKRAVKNYCERCGEEVDGLPFRVTHLLCKHCYGLDRYRKQIIAQPELRIDGEPYFAAVKVA